MEIKDALEIYNEQAKLGKMINSNEECLVAMAKASEKQISLKLITKTDKELGYMYCCPKCGNFICGESAYCCDCGQKIDWNEEVIPTSDTLPSPEDTHVW